MAPVAANVNGASFGGRVSARADHLYALVPALRLQFAPVLARLDILLAEDTRVQAVTVDLARRLSHA